MLWLLRKRRPHPEDGRWLAAVRQIRSALEKEAGREMRQSTAEKTGRRG
jgi:hypothetical protein